LRFALAWPVRLSTPGDNHATLSERVFTLSDFHCMTADAAVGYLVAMFFGASVDVTWTLHLYALLNVHGLGRLLQSISYQPGYGATRCRFRGRILTQGINAARFKLQHEVLSERQAYRAAPLWPAFLSTRGRLRVKRPIQPRVHHTFSRNPVLDLTTG
jgi:hypothetical protein